MLNDLPVEDFGEEDKIVKSVRRQWVQLVDAIEPADTLYSICIPLAKALKHTFENRIVLSRRKSKL